MLRDERLIQIENIVNRKKTVSLQELMKLLASSESTIRGDLVYLDSMKKLKRVHGGACANDYLDQENYSVVELGMEEKENVEVIAKKIIASVAIDYIKDYEWIYLDAGSSTKALAYLLNNKTINVVTNCFSIAKVLMNNQVKVYLTGGNIRLNTDALVGSFALDMLDKFHFSCGFFGANGISQNGEITTPDEYEAAIKKKAMERCEKKFLLVDHSKFKEITAITFANTKDTIIITDEEINNDKIVAKEIIVGKGIK